MSCQYFTPWCSDHIKLSTSSITFPKGPLLIQYNILFWLNVLQNVLWSCRSVYSLIGPEWCLQTTVNSELLHLLDRWHPQPHPLSLVIFPSYSSSLVIPPHTPHYLLHTFIPHTRPATRALVVPPHTLFQTCNRGINLHVVHRSNMKAGPLETCTTRISFHYPRAFRNACCKLFKIQTSYCIHCNR